MARVIDGHLRGKLGRCSQCKGWLKVDSNKWGTARGEHARRAQHSSPSLHIISTIDLHVHDILLCILSRMPTAIFDGINDSFSDLRRHITTRATQVQISILLMDQVIHKLLFLLQPVCDIDLFLLLSAQSKANRCERSFFVVTIELLLITVFDPVSRSEEQGHGRDFFSCSRSCHSFFDEGSHGGDPSSQADHEQRSFMGFWHDNSCLVDLRRHANSISDFQILQPSSALTDTEPSTGCIPIISDDAQMACVLSLHTRRRSNGVQSRLNVGDIVNQMANCWGRTWKLLKKFGVCVALLPASLICLFSLARTNHCEFLFLARVCGAHLQHFIKTALR